MIAFILDLGIKRGLERFGAWLMGLGTLGLFTISLLDSAFVPLPSGPDLVMIGLTVSAPEWMLVDGRRFERESAVTLETLEATTAARSSDR